MSFVDRVVVQIAAGDGGSGSSSFARFKFRPKGGPDGGDGGHGGSVYVRAESNLTTLLDYSYRNHWTAQPGGHGKGKQKTGATADDLFLPVPPGTVVEDQETGAVIGEVVESGDTLLVARGGRGGRGNTHFATATHQAPRECEPGTSGERRALRLVLKLIADVGLVGEPNAGKSTLLSVVSAARPKVADYPFTTLVPNLGVVQLSGSRTVVVADIPGIIEGAHQGKGLGLQFLQHVERTRILLYLIPLESEDPQGVYQKLRREVALHSPILAARPHLVVLSKADLLPADADPPTLDAPDALAIHVISSVAGLGIDALKELLWQSVQGPRQAEAHDD